ncbi:hypothetical protein SAMN04488516_11428 [Desulfonauticus submarinus]|uniref:Uncharacterized protein n=1 Tax=Desulfonauticus submarinus TaxID=206665 RepID=A0A1H0FTT3_9BACT|nr:DUF2062 domain-containing protein [Desulfonauticus submarinus]SDN98045.1 hypothetical protein SAMN04488516_11428 [Desulfonauticus submarinus]
MKILILIPVYNHVQTLRKIVQQTLEIHSEVLVVDDGSTDGSGSSVKDLNIHFIRHTKNQGKGAAILTGLKKAIQLGATHIITIDADGQHSPKDIPKFIKAIQQNPFSIIVGVRNFEQKTIPKLSRFGKAFSNFWFYVQTGEKVKDIQSGFRAYPIAIFKSISLWTKRYAFEIEILVKAKWAGIKIIEIPINVFYPPASKRISHFHLIKDNLQITLLNTYLTSRAFFPWPHKKLIPTSNGAKYLNLFQQLQLAISDKTTPFIFALSAALGILLGTLPLVGCHSIAIIFSANILRLNKIIALGTSQLCIPPIIPALCIETGHFLWHGNFLTEISLKTLGYEWKNRLLEWIYGSIVLAPLLAILTFIVSYMLVYILIKGFKKNG